MSLYQERTTFNIYILGAYHMKGTMVLQTLSLPKLDSCSIGIQMQRNSNTSHI